MDEIFAYLKQADKPCIVAIDEFQQIGNYAEKNVEAILRTKVQHCQNARFIFAGSQKHIMMNMFNSPARPFYQSVNMMQLKSIPLTEYKAFVERPVSYTHLDVYKRQAFTCVPLKLYWMVWIVEAYA